MKTRLMCTRNWKRYVIALFGAALWLMAGTVRAEAVFQGQEIKKGDEVILGRTEQDNDSFNGTEEISWRVLDINEEEGIALLISSLCLDMQPFHVNAVTPGVPEEITWEKCSLRASLNSETEGGFYRSAFKDKERKLICKVNVIMEKNGHFEDADPGNNTQDYIFLLSEEEAKKYFSGIVDRRTEATATAMEKQKKSPNEDEPEEEETSEDKDDEDEAEYLMDTTDTTGCSYWWLRTPGEDNTFAECVGAEGSIVQSGYFVNETAIGVRPAMWVRLD